MAASSNAPANLREALNRGYNLAAALALGLTGLTFGSVVFPETDPLDKVDNSLLAIIGAATVIWYFTSRHWAQRSPMPIAFAGLALAAQIAGFVIEIGDSAALGDDIAGMILFVSLLIILAVLYTINGRYLSQLPTEGWTPPGKPS